MVNKTQKKNNNSISRNSTKMKKTKKNRMRLNSNSNVNKIWNGYGVDIIFGLLYLLKKYDNLCFPLNTPNDSLSSMTLSMICESKVNNASKKEHYKFRFPNTSKTLALMIKKCSENNRFIAVPVYVIFDDCKLRGHMNILLFDTKTNEIERFDPYGKNGYTKKEKKPFLWFDEYFMNWLKENELDYKYNTWKNGPSIGPQELEELQIENNKSNTPIEQDGDPYGFCGVWVILFLDYRLKNPNLSTKEILKRIMKIVKKNNLIIRDWIRDYSLFITKHREDFITKNRMSNNALVSKNIWYPRLEREVQNIFKERIYGKQS